MHSLARNLAHPELIPIVFAGPDLDVNGTAEYGWTPLHYAAFAGNLPFIEQLDFETCDVNAADDDDLTPLHLAARRGHSKVVQFLIGRAGAIVTLRARSGASPMHESVCGNPETVAIFLDCMGVNPNETEESGMTPLHCAVVKQRLDIVQLLVQSERIDVNCRNAKQETPLHLAVGGLLEIVQCLAACPRVDVNRRDRKVFLSVKKCSF